MDFETLRVERAPRALTVTLHRPAARNAMNARMLDELHAALDLAEGDAECALVVLQGEGGVFCTGMDFEELVALGRAGDAARARAWAGRYMDTLRRFTRIPRVVVAKLDGQVLAGGVGFVAASDVVVATARTQFALPEALWGLLPANVAPYLIRRVGFQQAYAMALTTATLSAAEARQARLVDELTDHPDDAVRRLLLRVARVDPATVGALKDYFRQMWIVTEPMERTAVEALARLVTEPRVQDNVRSFVERGRFPWDR